MEMLTDIVCIEKVRLGIFMLCMLGHNKNKVVKSSLFPQASLLSSQFAM